MKKTIKNFLKISKRISLPLREIKIRATHSTGPGGQNINKTLSAIHLHFNIKTSSLPDGYKQRLLKISDKRITKKGIIVIKAKRFRDKERNREDGLKRLSEIISSVFYNQNKRVITLPGKKIKQKRSEEKIRKSKIKNLRKKIKF